MKKVELSGLDLDVEPDGEKVNFLARLAISAVPVVGGPMMEIFNSVFEVPCRKRGSETKIQIGEVVNKSIDEGGRNWGGAYKKTTPS